MGQILRRISKIAKTYMDDSEPMSNVYNSNNDDDELKRIIDELNTKSKTQNSHNQQDKNKNASYQTDSSMSFERALNLLDLSSNATIDEIKSAYKKKIMEYHPDRVASLGAELKELAARKTVEINQAYSFLKKLKGF
ncbi:MAG: hypothetical protein HW421_1389 [Ignavibacteria bacterium]|nr:hypothetical protein [Ignavibacteria bacterium]